MLGAFGAGCRRYRLLRVQTTISKEEGCALQRMFHCGVSKRYSTRGGVCRENRDPEIQVLNIECLECRVRGVWSGEIMRSGRCGVTWVAWVGGDTEW